MSLCFVSVYRRAAQLRETQMNLKIKHKKNKLNSGSGSRRLTLNQCGKRENFLSDIRYSIYSSCSQKRKLTSRGSSNVDTNKILHETVLKSTVSDDKNTETN